MASTVALGGGCFYNRILTGRLIAGLTRRGLRVCRPQTNSCGDAGLALGQAWVAREQLGAQLCEMNFGCSDFCVGEEVRIHAWPAKKQQR